MTYYCPIYRRFESTARRDQWVYQLRWAGGNFWHIARNGSPAGEVSPHLVYGYAEITGRFAR